MNRSAVTTQSEIRQIAVVINSHLPPHRQVWLVRNLDKSWMLLCEQGQLSDSLRIGDFRKFLTAFRAGIQQVTSK